MATSGPLTTVHASCPLLWTRHVQCALVIVGRRNMLTAHNLQENPPPPEDRSVQLPGSILLERLQYVCAMSLPQPFVPPVPLPPPSALQRKGSTLTALFASPLLLQLQW